MILIDHIATLINQKLFNIPPPEAPQSDSQLELAKIQLAIAEVEARACQAEAEAQTRQAEVEAQAHQAEIDAQAKAQILQSQLDHEYCMRGSGRPDNSNTSTFDVSKNIRLVPEFNESDVNNT